MKSTLRRGFTIKELVVVVGVTIIGGLLALPYFARSVDCQRHYTCPGNLKQIALGFKQYLNDFDERYPLVVVTDATGTTYAPPYGWADALQPYLKNTQVMQCPSDATEGNDDSSKLGFSDYWFNANFIVKTKDQKGVVHFLGAKESSFGSAAQTILIADGGNYGGNPVGDARYNQCGDGSGLTDRNQVCTTATEAPATLPSANIHVNGCNFAFADGMVRWVKATNASQCAQVLNNGARVKTIGGAVTFSLLNS